MNRGSPGRRADRLWRIGVSSMVGLGLIGSPILEGITGTAVAIAQSVPAPVREAYTLLGRGLVNQAITAFQQVLRQSPRLVEARLGLAIAYRRAGRDAEALQAYEQVLETDPDNRLALMTIGILGGYRTEWQNRGITALNRLLENNSNDMEARAQRALLYGYQSRFAEAIADYNIVLQRNPTPDAVLGAAQVYAYSGNYSGGLALFNRYRETGGAIEGSAAIAYALALRQTGNPAQAVQVLESQLRQTSGLTSTTIQMRSSLAIAYAATGQFDQAASVLTPLRGRSDSRMILARALHEIGQSSGNPVPSQEAIALYREVLTQAPNLTVGLAREVADVLSSYPQEQSYALEIYRQLAQQQPGDRGLLVQQTVLERQLGLISNADLQQRLQTSLQILPDNLDQQRAIAQALTRLDAPSPDLLPLYQRLLQAEVDEPLLNFRIAQMLIQRNEFAAAKNALAAYAATPQGMQNQATSLLLLAEIDRREGNLQASAQRYQTIISSNPSDAGVLSGALQGLAGILQSQGRLPEAVALYDQIIARNPQDQAKQLGRASLAYQARLISQAEAEAVLSSWVSVRPLTDTPPELVSLVSALPANPQREALYAALLETNPDSVPLQLRLVQVMATRNPNLAQAEINRLIARDPENVGAYFVQGQLAQELGNLNLASRSYETILGQNPNNVDALSALGGIRFQQRRFDSASQIYNEVLAIDPSNTIAQTSLISLTAVQGRRLEALQQLEQLQLQQSSSGQVDPNLAQQQQQLREGFLQQRGFQPPWERF